MSPRDEAYCHAEHRKSARKASKTTSRNTLNLKEQAAGKCTLGQARRRCADVIGNALSPYAHPFAAGIVVAESRKLQNPMRCVDTHVNEGRVDVCGSLNAVRRFCEAYALPPAEVRHERSRTPDRDSPRLIRQ